MILDWAESSSIKAMTLNTQSRHWLRGLVTRDVLTNFLVSQSNFTFLFTQQIIGQLTMTAHVQPLTAVRWPNFIFSFYTSRHYHSQMALHNIFGPTVNINIKWPSHSSGLNLSNISGSINTVRILAQLDKALEGVQRRMVKIRKKIRGYNILCYIMFYKWGNVYSSILYI